MHAGIARFLFPLDVVCTCVCVMRYICTFLFLCCLAASSAPVSLLEMEGVAIHVSRNYLTLVGTLTVFALNEPLWASTPQGLLFQTGDLTFPMASSALASGA